MQISFPREWLIVIQSPGKTSPGWSKMIDLCLMWAFFHEAYLYSFICVIWWCITRKDTHRSKIPNMRIKIQGLRILCIFKTQVFKFKKITDLNIPIYIVQYNMIFVISVSFYSIKEKYIYIIWHIIFYITASTF